MTLRVHNLLAGYGPVQVLRGINLEAEPGEVFVVLGPNGAGKSTLMRALSGVEAWQAGDILLDGVNLSVEPAHTRARLGLAHVPERRGLFPAMSVEDNLLLGGAPHRKDRSGLKRRLAEVYERFPVLGDRRRQLAGLMSGGEQQMCAIGRALMASPKVLLIDEPSQGLAPIVVEAVGRLIREVAASGVTVLLAEQSVSLALGVATRGIVMRSGEVVLEGSRDDLSDVALLGAAYLGQDSGGQGRSAVGTRGRERGEP